MFFLLVELAFVCDSSGYVIFIGAYHHSDQVWDFLFLSLTSKECIYRERKSEELGITRRLHREASNSIMDFVYFVHCHIPKGQNSFLSQWKLDEYLLDGWMDNKRYCIRKGFFLPVQEKNPVLPYCVSFLRVSFIPHTKHFISDISGPQMCGGFTPQQAILCDTYN